MILQTQYRYAVVSMPVMKLLEEITIVQEKWTSGSHAGPPWEISGPRTKIWTRH